ncbi:MAG: AHH domain-containing protein [Ruminococcus flavefaciens]|nr:AHH domain-containing protein [Ruminococcus flavefaciens]
MAAVDRETATGIIRESLSAYRKKVIDSSKLKKELYPEGRELIDDLYNNRDGIIFIFADAIGNPNFFDGIDDEGLLEYVRLCQQIMKAIGESYDNYGEGNERIEKILDDKDENKKGIWETVWGALQGEFNENPSGSEILIDMGLNFIPFVGQACDARDIAACLKKLIVERRANEIAIWVTLLLTAIGCVPYAGDVVKAGCKAILKGADDIFLAVLKRIDAENTYRGFLKFRSKFVSSIDNAIEMVYKWIEEARKSKYGSKVDSILASASENLRKAVEFMRERIDEFGERLFGKNKASKILRDNDSMIMGGAKALSVPNSKLLRKNLIEAGIEVPNYPNAAHHIVAGNSPKAAEARAILQKYNIDINSASNGVFLPTVRNATKNTYHPGLHTDSYYRKVTELLSSAKTRDDVLDILDDIASRLQNGTF